jgi:hypothetical protein
VRLGRGGDRKSSDTVSLDTATELAQELGVNLRTAQRRLSLARNLADHPDLAEKVDAGEMAAKEALRAKRRREGELLAEMVKAKGSDYGGKPALDGSRVLPSNPPPTLADLGITKVQSHRW